MARSEEDVYAEVGELEVETDDFSYRREGESAIDAELAELLAMIEAGDFLQETADAVVGQYEDGMSCVSPAGIAYRARNLTAMLARAEDGGPGQADVERWQDLGTQLRRKREGCGLSRQLLANLSGVPRDEIFCLEHGMLDSSAAKAIVPRLAKFLTAKQPPLGPTSSQSSYR